MNILKLGINYKTMTQENKINIAELLKDCPQGMELDCTMYDNLYFNQVYDDSDCLYKIGCYTIVDEIRTTVNFTEFGTFNTHANSKCVIFPKGKTTWEGFVPPCKFKDGDIISSSRFNTICIFKGEGSIKGTVDFYCGIDNSDKYFFIKNIEDQDEHFGDINRYNFATEEEKAKLFQTIKDNGYKWNKETKTLEKLVEPRFKVGDRIRNNQVDLGNIYIIIEVRESSYAVNKNNEHNNYNIDFVLQDDWELVQNKFDITTLKPFDKVLVRCSSLEKWHIQFFEKYNTESSTKYPFICLCNNKYCQCIPYEGNEHLLDTSNNCDEFYKTW